MSKVFCVVRAVKEKSLADCVSSLERLGFNYRILKGDSSLELKVKRTLEIGKEKAKDYDWVMAVDADVIINRKVEWVENYCEQTEETNEDLFSFTAWLDCTERGLIDGLHLYKTSKCEGALSIIKGEDFSWHKGREEYEICQFLKKYQGFDTGRGIIREMFGTHLFYINNKGIISR